MEKQNNILEKYIRGSISEEEYNGLRETICLSSIPDLREKTIEGLHTPLDDCLQENEVEL